MNRLAKLVLVGCLLLSAEVRAAETSLTWYGHSAFRIVTPQGIVVMIDPWLSNPKNPAVQENKDPLAAIDRLDYIIVTHAHFDHVGDAVALAKKTGAVLIAQTELSVGMVKVLGFPKEQLSKDLLLKPGEETSLDDGTLTVALTPAVHAVTMTLDKPGNAPNKPVVSYGETATGVIIAVKDGPTFYHSGDTAFFEGMAKIGKAYEPDVVLVNIDAPFGIDMEKAALVPKLMGASLAIPHHYGTLMPQDTQPFFDALAKVGIRGLKMEPGQTVVFEGKTLKE